MRATPCSGKKMPCPSPQAWLSTRAFKNNVATSSRKPRSTGLSMPWPADHVHPGHRSQGLTVTWPGRRPTPTLACGPPPQKRNVWTRRTPQGLVRLVRRFHDNPKPRTGPQHLCFKAVESNVGHDEFDKLPFRSGATQIGNALRRLSSQGFAPPHNALVRWQHLVHPPPRPQAFPDPNLPRETALREQPRSCERQKTWAIKGTGPPCRVGTDCVTTPSQLREAERGYCAGKFGCALYLVGTPYNHVL